MRFPWRQMAERARIEADRAEKRLAQVRAQRAAVERTAARNAYWLAENHISPKMRRFIRGGV